MKNMEYKQFADYLIYEDGQGGWFGIGNWWNSATLDVTGKLWENLVANIDDFDYTDEEKKQLIEENTI